MSQGENQYPKDDHSRDVVYVPSYYPIPEEADKINLIENWRILWGGKWFIAAFTFLCTLMAALVTLYLMPVTYQSNAVLTQR